MTQEQFNQYKRDLDLADAAVDHATHARSVAEIAAARAALQLARGYVQRAATFLGWNRLRLQRLMQKHEALSKEAERLRVAAGWGGGRPKEVEP